MPDERLTDPRWSRLERMVGRRLSPSYRRRLIRHYWPWDWDDLFERLEQSREQAALGGRYFLERLIAGTDVTVPGPAAGEQGAHGVDADEDEGEWFEHEEPEEPAAPAGVVSPSQPGAILSAFLGLAKEYYGMEGAMPFYLGLALLGVAASHWRVRLLGTYVRPSDYYLLLARSARGKSVLLLYAQELLRQACPQRVGPQLWSPEGLVSALAESPYVAVINDELSSLLKVGKKGWAADTIELVLSLWMAPAPFTRRLRQKRFVIAEGPGVSVVTATNPALLAGHVERLMGVGLFSRFLLAVEDDPVPVPLEPSTDSVSVLESRVVEGLRRISWSQSPPWDVSSVALEIRRLSDELAATLAEEDEDEPFSARAMAHMGKVVVSLAADGWTGSDAVEAAAKVVGQSVRTWQRVLREDLPRAPDERIMRRILLICRGRWVAWSELLERMQMRRGPLQEYVRTLLERGQLEMQMPLDTTEAQYRTVESGDDGDGRLAGDGRVTSAGADGLGIPLVS